MSKFTACIFQALREKTNQKQEQKPINEMGVYSILHPACPLLVQEQLLLKYF